MKVFLATCCLIISFLSQSWGKTYLVKTKDDHSPQRYQSEDGYDYENNDDYGHNNQVTLSHNQKREKLLKLVDDLTEKERERAEPGQQDYFENLIPIFVEHADKLCEFGIAILTEVFQMRDLMKDVDPKELCKAAPSLAKIAGNFFSSLFKQEKNDNVRQLPVEESKELPPPPPPPTQQSPDGPGGPDGQDGQDGQDGLDGQDGQDGQDGKDDQDGP